MGKNELLQTNGLSVVEIVALYMERKLNKEDMSPENQAMLEFYLGIMPDDPKFAAVVERRRKQMVSTEGQRTSLFPKEVIDSISKRKKKRKPEERAFQPSLWSENNPPVSSPTGGIEPRDKVMEMGKQLNGRFFGSNKLVSEEIRYKKESLRNEIGLPIARGKNPHVKDMFYKYLVKRICNFDVFGIFAEDGRVWVERDEELETKISEVKNLVGKLVEGRNLTRQEKFKMFNSFLDEYKNRWEG